jgi:hypothetical protein
VSAPRRVGDLATRGQSPATAPATGVRRPPQSLAACRQNPHRRRQGEDRLDIWLRHRDVPQLSNTSGRDRPRRPPRFRYGHPRLLGDSRWQPRRAPNWVADRRLDHPHPVGEIGANRPATSRRGLAHLPGRST